MKVTDVITLQKEAMTLFENSFKQNRLSHAYLFEGTDGCGKFELATYISMRLLCASDNAPCMKCSNCNRILKGNHLNVTIIEPEGDMIKREQIDSFIHELMMTSLEKGPQIGIIKHAEKMNTSSSNALLKVLEEPAPNHYIFLLSSNSEKLLDTIISRCQVVRFKPLSKNFINKTLLESGVDKDMSYVLSYISGNVDDAKKLIEEGKIQGILEFAKNIMQTIAKAKDALSYFVRNDEIIRSETNKNYHRIFIDILTLINKEIIQALNQEDTEYFKEIIDIYMSKNTSIKNISEKLEILNKYQERLNYYVNLNLFYTSLMVEINK